MGLKNKADSVFFISMVGVDKNGIVDEYEHIFDIFTKCYDFIGSDVQVKSAQDLWKFYEETHPIVKKLTKFSWIKETIRKRTNIYQLVEFFISHHPNGHYFWDECPILYSKRKHY